MQATGTGYRPVYAGVAEPRSVDVNGRFEVLEGDVGDRIDVQELPRISARLRRAASSSWRSGVSIP